MEIKQAVDAVRELTKHETYGDLFSLIEGIRQVLLGGDDERQDPD